MKTYKTLAVTVLCAAVLAACQTAGDTKPAANNAAPAADKKAEADKSNSGSSLAGALSSLGSAASNAGITDGKSDVGLALGAAGDATKAASLTDAEVAKNADAGIKMMDKKYRVAPAGDKYAKRLAKLTAKHVNEDGLKLNFKVYLANEVNAFAMPNGAIRFYSGLMDKMTDDELRFVIGHEIGHVKLQHSKEKLRTALMTSALRKGIAASGTVAGDIAASSLGGVMEAAFNAKFSRSEESSSDDYGLTFMKKHKYNAAAAETALRKLGELGDSANFLSSHPAPSERAQRMAEAAKVASK